jgi:tRNA pseudouridine55 synthase
MQHGFLIINKPSGPTSHDIVDRIRRITGEKRVGHAGTLDPFASGVLLVGVGREATREFPNLVGLDKRYRATLRLGATSDTDDRTGIIGTGQMARGTWFTEEKISDVLKKFTGKIEQIPPMYSAKKIGGKKLYELARAGLHVARSPSHVEIYSLKIIDYALFATPALPAPSRAEGSRVEGGHEQPLLKLEIHCSSGTYIRALARDIGEALGCGAYLEELERTAVGPFLIEEAARLDEMTEKDVELRLLSIADAITRCTASRQL